MHDVLTLLRCAVQHVCSTVGRWHGQMRAYGTDAHAHPISAASYDQHVKEAQEWVRAYRPFYSLCIPGARDIPISHGKQASLAVHPDLFNSRCWHETPKLAGTSKHPWASNKDPVV